MLHRSSRSHPVAIVSDYRTALDQLATVQTISNAKIITENLQNNNNRMMLLRVAKGVTISPSAGSSISVTTSSTGHTYMAPHQNWMRNRMVPTTSGNVRLLSHVPKLVQMSDFVKTPTTLPKSMLVRVVTDSSDINVHLDQGAMNLPKRKRRRRISHTRTPWQQLLQKWICKKIRWLDKVNRDCS